MAPVLRWRRVTGVSRCAIVCLLVMACETPAPVMQAPVAARPAVTTAASAPAAPAVQHAAVSTNGPPAPLSARAASRPVAEARRVVRYAAHTPPPQATSSNATIDDLLGGALGGGHGSGPTLGISGAGLGGGGLGTGYGHRHGVPSLKRSNFAMPGAFNTESYARVDESNFVAVNDQPLSTFSIDVDTASYANVRRFLNNGSLPPPDAVRVEEMLNYFHYRYPAPAGERPFSVYTEVSNAPWAPTHRLMLVGLQAATITETQTPPRNLVFLIDVSGSMASADKLPLLKSGLTLLARQLREQDRIAIVVYAGASGVVLPTTHGARHAHVIAALDQLEAGGSTNGGEGIELAYQMAAQSFIRGGVNRVVLATDGDFNVGVTSAGDLTRLIEHKRESGVYLSVLGFGEGNLQDSTMEALADRGNGNYAYIDSMREAERALVRQAGGTLVTLAKDVKLQVEFNPAHTHGYRLIGYDNRRLAAQDFNDDRKDAGEIGAGHSVTALYEIIPNDSGETVPGSVDPLRYQHPAAAADAHADELATIKIRYKAPDAAESTRFSFAVNDTRHPIDQASNNLRWAAAVASFGMILSQSEHRGDASLQTAIQMAQSAVNDDPRQDRAELVTLMRTAERLSPPQ